MPGSSIDDPSTLAGRASKRNTAAVSSIDDTAAKSSIDDTAAVLLLLARSAKVEGSSIDDVISD